MEQLVKIKSNKYCLEVCLNPEVSFDVLLQAIQQKFKDASKFFQGVQMAASFTGRSLTQREENQILNIITETTTINIICLIEHDSNEELRYKRILDQAIEDQEKDHGQFYRGTLSKRQTLESESSIIIIGDIELGAKVIAKGNIVVIGNLLGSVHAGACGNSDAFVAALYMHPKKLRICDVEAKLGVVYQQNHLINGPKIAVLEGKHIYIDPITDYKI